MEELRTVLFGFGNTALGLVVVGAFWFVVGLLVWPVQALHDWRFRREQKRVRRLFD